VATGSVVDPVSPGGPTFERCLTPALPASPDPVLPPDLDGLALDPRLPTDLSTIIGLQNQLVALAEGMRSFVTLLDVPPGLSHRQILAWRSQFDSSYAACYHPWLSVVPRNDQPDSLVRVPPSAVAAGLIARVENLSGVPQGPANVLAASVVAVDDRVSPARLDALHPQGVNVFVVERDGIRLVGARTLGRDPSYRQLSVRRLILMLRRAIDRQMQWVVFEPNNKALRAQVRNALVVYLRQFGRAGAFKGATDDQSFFVRAGDDLNPPRVADLGQLIFEIGVAPAEPMEFLVLRFERAGDGTLSMDEKGTRSLAAF
jgi:phage tail sheath protein FI